MTCNIPIEVENYLFFIENNLELVSLEQELLAKYLRNIFKKEELFFDYSRIEKYFSYQKYFPFDLFDWEKFLLILHCCTFKKNGNPRWPDLFCMVGRGAGKNGYISYESFCLISPANGIMNYDVDICATSEDQAKRSFEDVYEVMETPSLTKKLKKFFYWTKEIIQCKVTKSIIKYRTNNPKGKDGLRSGIVYFDEVHAFLNWENIEVFTGGLGKKPHPRRGYFSTNGDVRDGPLDELIEKSLAILNGEKDDNGMLPFICRLRDKKLVHDHECWNQANPSLRFLPDLLDEITKEYNDFKDRPTTNRSFMTKRMNLPEIKAEDAVTKEENIASTNKSIPNLDGMGCVCGIDYTKANDMASAGLLFILEDKHYWITKSWFCLQSADKERINAPLDSWKEMDVKGVRLLEYVDDVEISPHIITDWIAEMQMYYDIKKIATDNYRYGVLSKALKEIGYDAKEKKNVKMIRPSDVMKVQPKIDSLFNQQQIYMGNNVLMRWFIRNTKLVPKERDNFEYGKIEPKSRKTDGFMAFVAAEIIAEDAENSMNIIPDSFTVYTY